MRNEHELREQITFFEWVYLNQKHAKNQQIRKSLELCYGTLNGVRLTKAQAGKAKASCRAKGIPDINLDWPSTIWAKPAIITPENGEINTGSLSYSHCHGLRVEMKYKASVSAKIQEKIDTGNYLVDLKPEQKAKRELLIEAGYKYAVCYSAKQAIRKVIDYLPFNESEYQGAEFLR